MNSSVGWVGSSEDIWGSVQRVVANKSVCVGEVDIPKLCIDVAFNKNCETFIEPEVFPVICGDLVAGPLKGNLVNYNIFLRFVTSNCGSWNHRKERSLIAAHREDSRHHNNSEITPDIRSLHVVLDSVENSLESWEFFCSRINHWRFSKDTSIVTSWSVLKFTNNSGHKIIGHRDLIVEAGLIVTIECIVSASNVSAHVRSKEVVGGDATSICNTISWSILLWSNWSSVDILRESEKHRIVTICLVCR